MKHHNKFIVILFSSLIFCCSVSYAEENSSGTTSNSPLDAAASNIKRANKFGVGVSLGVGALPLSMKYFVTDDFSIQVNGPLWGVFWGLGLGASVDFLYEGHSFFKSDSIELAWQAGAGIDAFWYMHSREVVKKKYPSFYSSFGVNLNTGLQLLLTSLPIDFVLEYRPGIYFSSWARAQHTPVPTTLVSTEHDITTFPNGKSWSTYLNYIDFSFNVRYCF